MQVIVENGKVIAHAENVDEIKHLLSLQEEDGTHKCWMCTKSFPSIKGLEIHKTKIHRLPNRAHLMNLADRPRHVPSFKLA